MSELSIIVPVYKVEKYLARCIDSILAQTVADFELILIDDGSPDNCGKICDAYAAKDRRIVVIHQSNGGVSAARNAGLDIASGEFVGFVDPDDWVAPEMYAEMLGAFAGHDDTDMVCVLWRDVYENGEMKGQPIPEISSPMNVAEFIGIFLENPCSIGRNVWSKLFRKRLIKQYFDIRCAIGEDVKFLFEYSLQCKNIAMIRRRFYYLFRRNGSATRNLKTHYLDVIKVYNDILAQIKIGAAQKRLPLQLVDKAEAHLIDSCLWAASITGNKSDAVEIRMWFCHYIARSHFRFMWNRQIHFKQKLSFCYYFFIFCFLSTASAPGR